LSLSTTSGPSRRVSPPFGDCIGQLLIDVAGTGRRGNRAGLEFLTGSQFRYCITAILEMFNDSGDDLDREVI
jgi:hypothetical protein